MNLTSSNEERIRKAIPIGHVIVGSRTDGKGHFFIVKLQSIQRILFIRSPEISSKKKVNLLHFSQ
jgi:hypothetical protein